MPGFTIETTIEHVALGMIIQFDNGMVGQRITVEEYDYCTRGQDEQVEFDGWVPFRNLATHLVFAIPGDSPAVLVPAVPKAFTDSLEDGDD